MHESNMKNVIARINLSISFTIQTPPTGNKI